MATHNRSLKHLAFVGMLLGGATVLVYACGGDDTTPGNMIVNPAGGSSGAGGSSTGTAGDGNGGTTNAGGNAGGGTGGNAAGAAGAGNPDGGPVACEPSGTFDNATRLKGLLAGDGGLPAL